MLIDLGWLHIYTLRTYTRRLVHGRVYGRTPVPAAPPRTAPFTGCRYPPATTRLHTVHTTRYSSGWVGFPAPRYHTRCGLVVTSTTQAYTRLTPTHGRFSSPVNLFYTQVNGDADLHTFIVPHTRWLRFPIRLVPTTRSHTGRCGHTAVTGLVYRTLQLHTRLHWLVTYTAPLLHTDLIYRRLLNVGSPHHTFTVTVYRTDYTVATVTPLAHTVTHTLPLVPGCPVVRTWFTHGLHTHGCRTPHYTHTPLRLPVARFTRYGYTTFTHSCHGFGSRTHILRTLGPVTTHVGSFTFTTHTRLFGYTVADTVVTDGPHAPLPGGRDTQVLTLHHHHTAPHTHTCHTTHTDTPLRHTVYPHHTTHWFHLRTPQDHSCSTHTQLPFPECSYTFGFCPHTHMPVTARFATVGSVTVYTRT